MNYYVALRFRGEPDIHMTLRYYSRVAHLQSLISQVGTKVERLLPRKFHLVMHEVVTLGFESWVRTLVPSDPLPAWVYEFTEDSWIAHVTTMQTRLDLVVDAVAIMHKKQEIARWELL
jgi:hypothetical protein